ncbi:E3 ubiquitin-protein ligase RFWD3 like protein [Argiope bruennichi]|uniref:RING-type E3 ubiquitin transferase n=1 Tax=Argiope bruennichi TaxID=94029 RepID=A0A8T0E4Z0_ARGBR|nr:E3 ubiquitin-protein ligase RFWD3 like protein [Argiope bruennichi]
MDRYVQEEGDSNEEAVLIEDSEDEESDQSNAGSDGTCTICFDQWTNSSEHRLVSLRCGHLFGRSCITKWLKGQNARCPQCNARARKSEIRNIYAKAVKVIDSSERDKALLELKKEQELRKKAEMVANQERLKYMMSVQECERLKKELMEVNKLLQEYRCGMKIDVSQCAAKPRVSVYTLEKCMEIAKHGGCRIIDVCELLGMVLISQPSINELFPGHGFRKISTLDMKPSEFVLVHQKPIRDMSFHCHDGLVLTASLDKSLKITNVLTNSVVHTYPLDSDVWSCAWDLDEPTYFYAGTKNGDVYLFDIRMTNRYVHELPRYGNRTPVVALQYVKKAASTNYSKCGPLIGTLSECAFFQRSDNRDADYKIIPLPTVGPYTSLSSEPVSGHFLVSSRPSPKLARVTHAVCEFALDQSSENVVCNPIQMIQGGRSQLQLTRSKLLRHPDNPSSLLVCAGDEDSHGALVWDGSSGKCLDTLRTEYPVLDFGDVKTNNKTLLLALTDKNLRYFSWNSQ